MAEPGQLELNLQSLGADIYTGNLHKWLFAPKGAGFIYVRPELQTYIEPLIVSWGLMPKAGESMGSSFLDNLGRVGTEDVLRYLSVPTAIDFQHQHDWPTVRHTCHALLTIALAQLADRASLPPSYANKQGYVQLAIVALPDGTDPDALKVHLYDHYHIEIPVT